MKRLLLFLMAFGMVFAFSTTAYSQSVTVVDTGSIAVSAVVVATCETGTTDFPFGEYGDVAVEKSGIIDVRCTEGLDYRVALGRGNCPPRKGIRCMQNEDTSVTGPNRFLTYELYHDGGIYVWGDAGLHNSTYNFVDAAFTASLVGEEIPVVGKIPEKQNKPVGSYSDIVPVTVYY